MQKIGIKSVPYTTTVIDKENAVRTDSQLENTLHDSGNDFIDSQTDVSPDTFSNI